MKHPEPGAERIGVPPLSRESERDASTTSPVSLIVGDDEFASPGTLGGGRQISAVVTISSHWVCRDGDRL
jgi:hypothetical protein